MTRKEAKEILKHLKIKARNTKTTQSVVFGELIVQSKGSDFYTIVDNSTCLVGWLQREVLEELEYLKLIE